MRTRTMLAYVVNTEYKSPTKTLFKIKASIFLQVFKIRSDFFEFTQYFTLLYLTNYFSRLAILFHFK